MEILSIVLQIAALAFFIALIWPSIKNEKWKEKFIQNKQAFSLLIVFTLILIFTVGIGLFFDTFFPVETLEGGSK